MNICRKCGHIFDEGEEASWFEDRGQFHDENCFEKVVGCPICKSDFEKAKKCSICGSYHLKEDLIGDVCEECIDKYRKDFKTCYEISLGETEEIKINALLAAIFDVKDIEQILKEYIRERWQDVDCSPFIDGDIQWFSDKLEQEVKKNEC